MRIALDASAFFDGPTCARTYFRELIPELIRLLGPEDEILVLYPRSRQLPEQLVWLLRGPRLHRLPVPMPSGRLNLAWRRLGLPTIERLAARHLPATRAQICHSIAPPLLPTAASRRVLTVHSMATSRSDAGVESPGLVAAGIRRAHLVITPSTRTEQALRALPRCGSAQIEIIPSGVNDRFLRPPKASDVEALCDRYPFLQEPYLLALGGATETTRNLPFLLDAYGLAHGSEPDLPPLVVVSSSPAADEEIRRRQLDGAVLRLEALEGDSLVALYRGAELLLYPALDNAFGQGLLEAAACGVAAIADPSCGALEHLAEGVFQPELSPVAWAAEIVRLHRDPALRQDAGWRAQQAARPYTWESSARRLWELYGDLAAEIEG